MTRTGYSSTPVKANELESTSNKRGLPSPFSPEDHTMKKKRHYTSKSDINSSYESDLKMTDTMDTSASALHAGFGMGEPTEMATEI